MTDPAKVENRGLITLSVMLATIMQVLDSTIANVALPHMQGSLSAAQDTITWVLTSYIVAAAIMTPLTGWLADRMGRRRLFLTSIAGFTVASALCGVAQGLGEMVLFRLLQGVFGAALVPLSQSTMLDINPREKHAQAMALWGAGIMVAPIMGPTLGGWLTDSFDWRWVFFINLPIGVLAFLGLLWRMPKTEPTPKRFDILGFLLLGVAIGAFQLMLDRGEQKDWFSAPEIVVECGLAIGAFWMFLIHLFTAREPFIEPKIFANANFSTSLFFIFMVGALVISISALIPTMLQNLMNYSTFNAGLVLGPRGIGTMIAMLAMGRALRRGDPRVYLGIGLVLNVVSAWWMTKFTLVMGWMPFVLNGVVAGFGMGLLFAPLSALSLSTLAPALRTQGAGLFSLMRNVGGSVGISILATQLAHGIQVSHADLAVHVSPFNPAWQAQLLGMQAAVLAPFGGSVVAMADAEVNRQASMIAYLDDFQLITILSAVCIPALFFMRKPRPPAAAGGAPAQDGGHSAAELA